MWDKDPFEARFTVSDNGQNIAALNAYLRAVG